MNAAFPSAAVHIGTHLLLDFDALESDAVRPQFLGHSHCREQYQHWIDHLPAPTPITPVMQATDPDLLKSFAALIQTAIEAGKNKPKTKKSSAAKHALAVQDAATQLLLARKYLKPTTSSTPFKEDSIPILLAIDCEAHENPPHPITEIGLAIIDPTNLPLTTPNPQAKSWHPHIRARHLRTAEYRHVINHRFCSGNPSDFRFGTSEFVPHRLLPEVLTSAFRELQPRHVVLVGHDLPSDLAFLSTLPFDPTPWVAGMLDTQALFRAHTRDANANPTALGKVLGHFGLVGWGAHNAGNDAVYTLWALLAMGVAAETCGRSCGGDDEDFVDEGQTWRNEGDETREGKPVFGPPRPPVVSRTGLYTMGGVPLDV